MVVWYPEGKLWEETFYDGVVTEVGVRHYGDILFCKADRMAWVYNITDFETARQLKNDAMKAIVAVFQFTAHQDPSCVHWKAVSLKVPHIGYFMPIGPYRGTQKQFLVQRTTLRITLQTPVWLEV